VVSDEEMDNVQQDEEEEAEENVDMKDAGVSFKADLGDFNEDAFTTGIGGNKL
jgi:hypothetical protein